MGFGSIHDLRADAYNYVWDNSIEPALELESGEEIELHARDASDEQITERSTAADVTRIDTARINPVSGPVFVKGARPGDTLAGGGRVAGVPPQRLGWTATTPGFGLLADEFPDPWLRISSIDADRRTVGFSDRISLPLRPFPGTLGVAPADPGKHPILPPTRAGGNLDIRHLTVGSTLYVPVQVEERCSPSATPTLRRETAKSAAPRSRARWTSRCG